ncbi:MAG: glutathione S-transferase family protein [Thermomicrobiales bacterium]|nr:glutathione S-transferase family protein [Thermomicrobiales bacterium]
MLTVWGRINSINVQKVLWTLAEIGLAYHRIDAGMKFGVNDTPEYKAKNPNGLVPTIDDDGYVLWESNAIVRYLAAKHAPGTLYLEEIGARFHAEQWMDWQATAFNAAISPVFLGLIRTPPEKRDDAGIAALTGRLEALLATLDAHLADRAYVNGEAFTMADIPVGAGVNRWYKLPLERQPRPHVEGWLERLKARPGFRAHVLDIPLS